MGDDVKKWFNIDKIAKKIYCTYTFFVRCTTDLNLLRFWYTLDLVGEILSFQ